MAKPGFLGLGIMGSPMARRLMQAGHVGLRSHSTAEARDLASAHGGVACATPAGAARRSECEFLRSVSMRGLAAIFLGLLAAVAAAAAGPPDIVSHTGRSISESRIRPKKIGRVTTPPRPVRA